MRILYVTNMYPWEKNPYYGIFVKEQIEGLTKYFDIEYKVIFINGKHGKQEYLKSVFTVNQELSKNRYDIIHIHYGLSGLFALFRFRKTAPIIVTLHSGDIDPRKSKHVQIFITKQLLKKSAGAIILNEEMYQTAVKFARELVRIPCGVNTDIFKPMPKAASSPNTLKLVFPGSRNRWAKNFPLFMEVVELLKERQPLPVEYKVLENISRSEIARLFNETDCVLMTSHSEGSPQVIKEAMACNAGIVSTRVGDVDVLLEHVENARVEDSFSPSKLADHVLKVTGNRKTNRNGREEIFNQQLDEEAVSRRVYAFYQKFL